MRRAIGGWVREYTIERQVASGCHSDAGSVGESLSVAWRHSHTLQMTYDRHWGGRLLPLLYFLKGSSGKNHWVNRLVEQPRPLSFSIHISPNNCDDFFLCITAVIRCIRKSTYSFAEIKVGWQIHLRCDLTAGQDPCPTAPKLKEVYCAFPFKTNR